MDIYFKIINKLNSNPGIMGRYKYFNSVVFVPFLKINNEYYLLFQKRAVNISQGGEICFPGGKYEKSDLSFKETAIRETSEELGLDRDKIIVNTQMDSIVAPMGAIIDIFIGKINVKDINELRYNKSEVDEVFIVPLQFFIENKPEMYSVQIKIKSVYKNKKNEKIVLLPSKRLNLPEKYHEEWYGQNYPVYVYKTDYGIIWGITAEIIFEVCNLIKQ